MRFGAAVREPGERRCRSRARVEVEVSIESDHNFFAGLAQNMSEGGLFVATHSLPEIGTIVDLLFTLAEDGPPIVATAVVRWLRLYNEASDAPPGAGLQFVQLGELDLASIRRFVARRPSLLWE